MIKKILILFIVMIVLVGCNKKESFHPFGEAEVNDLPPAYGNHQDVYVFSNESLSQNVLDLMKEQFGYNIDGAQNERTFFMEWKSFDAFEDLKRARNIIFICNLNNDDAMSSLMQKKLSEGKYKLAKEKRAAMYTYNNVWSDDQIVSFIVAGSKIRLEDVLSAKIPNLYIDYSFHFLKSMTERSYYRGVLSDKYFDNFDFALKIPDSFQLYNKNEEENMISFIYRYNKKDTVLPDKFITVYYDHIEKDDFDKYWTKYSRDNIGTVVLDGDDVVSDRNSIMSKNINFWYGNSYSGYVYQGAWENKKTNQGGSFKSYSFYDEKNKVAYLIDTCVYYPAGTKIPYIYELEGIAKSFYIKEK